MARLSPFAAHCLDLLSGVGRITTRSMFGGIGFYADGSFIGFAETSDGPLYLRADATTRETFVAAGGEPFVYAARGKREVSMGYYTLPPEALDDPATMLPWARLALAAAERARAKQSTRGRSSKSKPGSPARARKKRSPERRPAAKARPRRERDG